MRQSLSSVFKQAVTAVIAVFSMPAMYAFGVAEIIPANRSAVESLTSITLKLDAPLGEWQPEPYALPINNAPLTYQAIVHLQDRAREINITIEPELNLPGTYEIIIPKEYIWDENFEYLPEIQLVYVVENEITPPDDLVKYDLAYNSITPVPGRINEPLSKISLIYDDEIFVTEETEEHHVRGRLYNQLDMVVANGVVTKASNNVVEVALSNIIKNKGNYKFVIEKGVIGDSDWNQDNSKGHANDIISVEYAIEENTSVDGIVANGADVYAVADCVVVSGAAYNTSVSLFTISGVLLDSVIANAPQVTFDGLNRGIYLVKVGNTVCKVAVTR